MANPDAAVCLTTNDHGVQVRWALKHHKVPYKVTGYTPVSFYSALPYLCSATSMLASDAAPNM